MAEEWELAIVGGGPAGSAAAVYAARKRLKTLFLTSEWGGQSAVSSDIQNWIGSPSVSGDELAANLRKHVESYAGERLRVVSPAEAVALSPFDDRVEITLKNGETYRTKALLVATGAHRRRLEIPGAATFDQKGLTYCASCDGPLFAGKDVAVVGGGNAGFETALQLLSYCKSVSLLHRGAEFKADAVSISAALAHPNMRAIKNAEPAEVLGDRFVSGLRFKHLDTGAQETIPVEGIFVEIGLVPNTGWIGGALEMNEFKQIKADPKRQRASHPRVWAAGDCADGLYHQNNIAAGDAIKALEDIYLFLRMH